MTNRAGIIGGTGFETALAEHFGDCGRADSVRVELGDVAVSLFAVDGGEIVFVPRHGSGHATAPHKIDHIANLTALRSLGAAHILATSAVGSLKTAINPGDLVIPDDFIDMRGGAPTTAFRDAVVHTDFSRPFSLELRGFLNRAASDQVSRFDQPGSIIHPAGVYLCVAGPRYETPAEVRLFASWGADIIGMTVAPEAIIARELGLQYACLSVATNLGTGLAPRGLSHGEVEATMAQRRPLISSIIIDAAVGMLRNG